MPKEKCECGRTKKTFMHHCPDSSECIEIEGCPKCDDHCGFCKEVSELVE